MFEVGKIYGEDAVKYEVTARTKKNMQKRLWILLVVEIALP